MTKQLNNISSSDYVIGLDVETYNGFQYPIIYDLGYCILNTKTLKIEKRVSTLITNTYKLDAFSDSVYYSAKDERYQRLINDEAINFMSYEEALQGLKSDLEKYNITGIYAYNYTHEKKSFKATTALLLPDWMEWVQSINWLDAMDFIGILTEGDDYKTWCETNDKITASRMYISTKLEHVYQYVFNDIDFIEQHTGYDDAYRMLQLMYQVGLEYGLSWYGDYKAKRFISRDINYKTKIIYLPDGTKKYVKYNDIIITDDYIKLTLND